MIDLESLFKSNVSLPSIDNSMVEFLNESALNDSFR